MLWLVTLPFRLLLGILLIPFLVLLVPFFLLRALVKTLVALIVLPIVFVGLAIGLCLAALALSFAVVIPLLPFLLAALLFWMVVKRSSPVATGVRG